MLEPLVTLFLIIKFLLTSKLLSSKLLILDPIVVFLDMFNVKLLIVVEFIELQVKIPFTFKLAVGTRESRI